MIDYKQLEQYIDSLEKLLLFLRDYRNKLYEDSQAGDYLREFHYLKELVRSSAWPEAIDPGELCTPDSEDDKNERAATILSNIVRLEKLSFLDFGCGEGHVAHQAAQIAMKVVGFEFTAQERWGRWARDNVYFTTNLNDLNQHGPFDVILLYDVLDHIDNPVEILKLVKSLRRINGPIYIHCHPWASRHATHLYHQINKAFLHVIFSEQELLKLGYKGKKTAKLLHSMGTYRKWFADAGLQVKTESPNRRPVEDIFLRDPTLQKRMKAHWPDNLPINELKLESVDYIVA
jgi:2-polyprenyl-3-methyl-5-hydroxy-6-metoxy-1,4-benzoquinol methylase